MKLWLWLSEVIDGNIFINYLVADKCDTWISIKTTFQRCFLTWAWLVLCLRGGTRDEKSLSNWSPESPGKGEKLGDWRKTVCSVGEEEMSSLRTSADWGKEGGPEEMERKRSSSKKKKKQKGGIISVYASACDCMLTDHSPGPLCVCAVAPHFQADVGSSEWGPEPGEPSSVSGPRKESSLLGAGGGVQEGMKWISEGTDGRSAESVNERGRERCNMMSDCMWWKHTSVAKG